MDAMGTVCIVGIVIGALFFVSALIGIFALPSRYYYHDQSGHAHSFEFASEFDKLVYQGSWGLTVVGFAILTWLATGSVGGSP